MYGKEHHKAMELQADLADIYQRQQNYDASFALLEEAINISSKTLGPQHHRTLYCIKLYEFYKWEVSKVKKGPQSYPNANA